MDAIRDGAIRPVFSHETWTEFDDVLERWRLQNKITRASAQDVRSALLEAGDIRTVDKVFSGCRDPNDDMLVDVLEQTDARWLCTDDPDLHDLNRPDIVGMGELVRMLDEEG